MFTDPFFYVALAGWGSFAYILGHNITTGAAYKVAVAKELAELKAKYDAWTNKPRP